MSTGLSLLAAAREHADRDALVVGERTYRYLDLAPIVSAWIARLGAMGLVAGSRVAITAANRLETLVAIYALLELGVAIVPLHPRLTPSERAALVDDAEPVRTFDDAALETIASEARDAPWPARPTPSDSTPLAMLYTSGTTGRAKGAILTRAAFLASAAGSEANLGWNHDDRWLLCLPLCHIGGLSIVTRCLIARRCLVLGPRFEAGSVLQSIRRDRVTLVSLVPTMLRALLDTDDDDMLARPRAVLIGGAATPPTLLERSSRRGVRSLTTYGLTEACSQVTTQRLADAGLARSGSGRPLRGVSVAVTDVDGRELPRGEVGTIRVRGPILMEGYFRREPLGGAWLETGDLGYLDAGGELHVEARRNDLIVTGGENVYPAEVEHVIEAYDGVKQALVFGVPDEVWGQRVAAIVVRDPPRFDAGFNAWLQSRLARFKLPRAVCIAAELPVLGTGKVDRATAIARFTPSLSPWDPMA